MGLQKWRLVAFSVLLTAYFAYFTWDGIFVHFAADDMMNMAGTWRMGIWRLVAAQFMPWIGYYRPFSGLIHVPLICLFGLNPVPFHLVMILILLGNAFLTYRFSRLLGCSGVEAGIASFVVAYHPGLYNLYYNTAFIYDVLCYTLYFGTMTYYVRIRTSRTGILNKRQLIIFLLLYLCALNSKEMAVTLPLVLMAYELFLGPNAGWAWHRIRNWIFSPAILLAGVLDALSVYGKIFGPYAIASQAAYHPEFTFERFLNFQKTAMSDLFCKWNYFEWTGILVAWVMVTYLAWRRKNPVLRFCWSFIILAPIPIEFLPGRGQACLYIPLAGWAILAAVVLVSAAKPVAEFLSHEPICGWMGQRICLNLVLVLCFIPWVLQANEYKQRDIKQYMAETGQQSWDVIQKLRDLNPHIAPHSKVVFLDDPFKEFDMAFIAELYFRDRTVSVHLQKFEKKPPEVVEKADRIITYRDGKFVLLK